MDMAATMLTRLELERRVEADRGDVSARGLELLLTRCWGCNHELRSVQELKAGYLCKRCQRRRQWLRN
jgi:hypothetical protein